MRKYDHVLFDLDGTLTDPALGITNAVRYALERYRIYPATREELYPYIGPPLIDSFRQLAGLTADEARQALLYYREYFADRGLFENTVYPGMDADLTAAGASYTGLPLTIDGSIVTGEALGAAIPFALALARILAGADAANRVKSAIVYQ